MLTILPRKDSDYTIEDSLNDQMHRVKLKTRNRDVVCYETRAAQREGQSVRRWLTKSCEQIERRGHTWQAM